MSYGAHDALVDVVTDLRNHQPLVDLLESSDAITEGWPRDEQEHPVVVRVQPVTETSSHRGIEISRTFRFQFSVVATDSWLTNRSAPTYRMSEIMHEVSQRMDGGLSIDDVLPGETASGSWEDVSGDRRALIQDWQIESVQDL